MKLKFNFLLIMLSFAFFNAWSEAPYMINYQAVAHNASGTPIANQTVSIRASVRQLGAGGTIYYSEVRNVTTDANGLFSFQINGPGATSVTGIFSSINWSNGTKYLQIEMDPNGGTNYINMGMQQLVSVPYAQLANKADGLTPYGQMSIGAVAGDVIQFDGSNWKASTLVDGLGLPYLSSDPNLISFAITNTSVNGGTAITGKTSVNHTNATGVRGEASGANGRGVLGIAAGTSSFGVLGQNTSGVAIKGISSGSSSTGVHGESSGTTGTGVKGTSNGAGAMGVYGESMSGTGVKGYGNDAGSVAVFGSSLAGTGVKAYSFTGNALEVVGNVKISGGSVAPSDGAVLTSDASGNATWHATPRVAFRGQNVSQTETSGTANHTFSHSTYKKVEFFSEDHDLHNDFSPTGANAATANSSTFLVPVNGVYHFDAAVTAEDNYVFEYARFNVRLMMKRGGTTTMLAETSFNGESIIGNTASLSLDKSLLANDRLWIEFRQNNYSLTSIDLKVESTSNYFNGHLLYEN